MTRLDILKRDRDALVGLHVRLADMSAKEYNALVHAMWRIDREIGELNA